MVLQLLVAFISIFVVVIYAVYRNTLKIKYLKDVPGPEPFLCFGNMLEFAAGSHVFLNKLGSYVKEFGGIVKVHDGFFSAIVVATDYNFVEHIMSSNTIITKSDQYEYFHHWLNTGLLTSTGAKWKQRRRILTPSFHFSVLEEYIDIFESVGEVLIRKLDTKTGEDSVDIYPLISLCTLDIICEAAMGTSINAQQNSESEYVKNIKILCKVLIERSFSPLHPFFFPFTLNYYREKNALNKVHPFIASVINEKIKKAQEKGNVADEKKVDDYGIKKKRAFLDLLLQCTVDGKPLTKDDLMEEVNTFMFEGHDTTASAITFAFYAIAADPRVQEKLYQEQLEIFGDNLKKAKATHNELQQMKYLEMVIKEVLRLYPSVPFMGRRLDEDLKYDGILYPKGLNILVIPFLTYRDPKYFSDPEKFIPERFETYDGKQPYAYIPFSAGPRNCIGQKFAILEMKSTISKVVRNFELMPSKPEHKLILASESILVSKNGVRISLKKRK